MVEHDDVAGLLAAEGVAAGLHALEDVAVTDRGLQDLDAGAAEGLDHAEVGHDRRDERVAAQHTLLLHREREDRHDLVAVDLVPGRVDSETAVGVTVERDPEVGTGRDDGLLEVLEVRRAVAVVDVEPVRLPTDDGDRGPRLAERPGSHLRRGAVRGVDDDVQALEAVRQHGEQVGDIAVGAVDERHDAADVAAGGALPLVPQASLDAVLEVVGELVPAPGEELDAVVGHGVVRRREHGTEVGVLLGHEVGDRRGRQHACVPHVDAGRGEAGHRGGGEELARGARVAPDDRDGAVPVEGAHLTEDVRRGDGEVERELGGDVLVRHTTDAVRAEESSHACVPSGWVRPWAG